MQPVISAQSVEKEGNKQRENIACVYFSEQTTYMLSKEERVLNK